MLTDEEKEAISVERMIFHVVDPIQSKPSFLAEMDPPEFVDRVRDTLRGASYDFRPGSGYRPSSYRRSQRRRQRARTTSCMHRGRSPTGSRVHRQ